MDIRHLRPLPMSEQASNGIRRPGRLLLMAVLVALAGIIWWQHTRIQELESEQQQIMHSYAIDVLSGLNSADHILGNAIRSFQQGETEPNVLILRDVRGYINEATKGADRYNRMLSEHFDTRINIFDDGLLIYGYEISDLSYEIRTAGSVSNAQMTTLEDISYDLHLLTENFFPVQDGEDPVSLALRMNEATKGIKTQSVRQRLNLMPGLTSLGISCAGPDLPTISLESPTNCIMAGQSLTLTLAISNEQRR